MSSHLRELVDDVIMPSQRLHGLKGPGVTTKADPESAGLERRSPGRTADRSGRSRLPPGPMSLGRCYCRSAQLTSSHVVALAGDADDEAFVPEGRERTSRGAVRDLVLLGEGQDGRNPPRPLSSFDLAAQDRRELLVQRNR